MTSKQPCNYRHLHTPQPRSEFLNELAGEELEVVLLCQRVQGHPGEHFAFTDHLVFWEAKPHLAETV